MMFAPERAIRRPLATLGRPIELSLPCFCRHHDLMPSEVCQEPSEAVARGLPSSQDTPTLGPGTPNRSRSRLSCTLCIRPANPSTTLLAILRKLIAAYWHIDIRQVPRSPPPLTNSSLRANVGSPCFDPLLSLRCSSFRCISTSRALSCLLSGSISFRILLPQVPLDHSFEADAPMGPPHPCANIATCGTCQSRHVPLALDPSLWRVPTNGRSRLAAAALAQMQAVVVLGRTAVDAERKQRISCNSRSNAKCRQSHNAWPRTRPYESRSLRLHVHRCSQQAVLLRGSNCKLARSALHSATNPPLTVAASSYGPDLEGKTCRE